ncbi:MAG: filamentous hemagglutinin N-terminal domain-containing protein [Rhizonema sp. PD38]|nr:filamentous hemagglutinin N-terminal domain-containing protein [Rhizonema sp. PD38]
MLESPVFRQGFLQHSCPQHSCLLNAPCLGGVCTITNGSQRGGNLFHSFSQFSLSNPTGVADFQTQAAIQNVIVRVTGVGTPFISNINGTIRTSNPANFFLLNPNGIIFGPGATLNIGGAFLATTANRIQFKDGTQFTTTDSAPLLTITAPIGLGFTGASGNISMQSSFLSAGQTDSFTDLALVGGNVTLNQTTLRTPGGRVELGGLASPGTVGLNVAGNNLSLSFPAESARADVSLFNSTLVNVQDGGGGSIAVHARNLDITGGSSLIAGIRQGNGNIDAQAGDITLNATGDIKIDGDGSGISNDVQQQAIGNGGNIKITTNQLSVTNGAQLLAITFGQGNAGNIMINATKGVTFADNGTAVFSTVGAINNNQNNLTIGKGGNIQITTDQLSVNNGAQLATGTFGQGNTGNVIINATKGVTLADSGTAVFSTVGGVNNNQNNLAIGNGGNIQITTGELSLSKGAQLQAVTFGQGNAGNMMINATKGVTLTDSAQLVTSTYGQGNAGNIIINAAKSVSLDGFAYSTGQILSTAILKTVGEVSSIQNNLVKGNSGNIQITTEQLLLTNGAQLVTSTLGQGNAGNVIINATKSVSVDGNQTAIFSTVGSVNNNLMLVPTDRVTLVMLR